MKWNSETTEKLIANHIPVTIGHDIENVMKSCSDAYHTELLTEANEYMNKTEEAQQEIKNLVLNAGYMSVNSNNSLRQRLGNFSTPINGEEQNALESKSSDESWQDWYKRANRI